MVWRGHDPLVIRMMWEEVAESRYKAGSLQNKPVSGPTRYPEWYAGCFRSSHHGNQGPYSAGSWRHSRTCQVMRIRPRSTLVVMLQLWTLECLLGLPQRSCMEWLVWAYVDETLATWKPLTSRWSLLQLWFWLRGLWRLVGTHVTGSGNR